MNVLLVFFFIISLASCQANKNNFDDKIADFERFQWVSMANDLISALNFTDLTAQ